MKNKKLINLIIPLAATTVAVSAIPLTCFLASSTKQSNTKEPKKDPKFVPLKNSASPKDVDINDTLQPFTITSDSSTMMYLVETNMNDYEQDPNFHIQYRIGSVAFPEGVEGKWIFDWSDIADYGKYQLPIGNDIMIQFRCGYKTGHSEIGHLASKYLNFNFLNPQGIQNLSNVKIGGSVMSLLGTVADDSVDPKDQVWSAATEIIENNCFQFLFSSSDGTFDETGARLNFVSNFLPSTTLSNSCYFGMFAGSNILTAPILPATSLAYDCYNSMFANCKNLSSAPNLPATELWDGCYKNLFYGCEKIKSISLSYIGNFVKLYFEDWVYGVNQKGSIFYNGIDKTKSSSELPANFTVCSDDEDYILTYAKDIEFKSSSTAKVEGPKTKVRAYKNSSFKPLKLQISDFTPVTQGDNFRCYEDEQGNELDDLTKPVSEFPNIVKPVYGEKEPEVTPGYTNLIVKERSFIKLAYEAKDDNVQYSIDNGNSWFALPKAGTWFENNTKILLKANGAQKINPDRSVNYTNIQITNGKVALKGTIKSLLGNRNSLTQEYECSCLFENSPGLISVDEDYIPYESYTNCAFYATFCKCSNLKNAVKLKGKNFVDRTCHSMYQDCTNLASIPETTIESASYASFSYMFYGCEAIEDASNISIKINNSDLSGSFNNMFENCKSLTKPCLVKCTKLNIDSKSNTFLSMFNNCTKLYITADSSSGGAPFFYFTTNKKNKISFAAFTNTKNTNMNSAESGTQYYYKIVE